MSNYDDRERPSLRLVPSPASTDSSGESEATRPESDASFLHEVPASCAGEDPCIHEILAGLSECLHEGEFSPDEYLDLVGRRVTDGLLAKGEFVSTTAPARLMYVPRSGGGPIEVGDNVKAWRNYLADLMDDTSAPRLRAAQLRSTMTARQLARPVSAASFSAWDGTGFLLPTSEGRCLRIDAAGVKLTGNPSGDVLLLPDRTWQPIPPEAALSGNPELPLLRAVLASTLSFDETSHLTSGQQQALFVVWGLLPLLGNLVPIRPVLLALGPKGAGKTTALRMLGRFLLGRTFDVAPAGGPADFQAMACAMPLVVLDNMDSPAPWLEDALCRVSTGQRPALRQLFTTNTLVRYACEAKVALTARTPHFRRPDVADRLLILRLQTRGAVARPWRAERRIDDELVLNRVAMWQEVTACLQQLASRLAGGVPEVDITTRLTDFAEVGAVVAEIIGIRDDFLSGLVAMETEREDFIRSGLAGSAGRAASLDELLRLWLASDSVTAQAGHSASDLMAILERVAAHRSKRPDLPRTAVGLGRELAFLARRRNASIEVSRRIVRGQAIWSVRPTTQCPTSGDATPRGPALE